MTGAVEMTGWSKLPNRRSQLAVGPSRAIAAVAVLAMIGAGCGSAAAKPAAAPGATQAPTTTAAPTTTTLPPTTTTVKAFDPTKPIDLSGTPGETAAELTRAEGLLKSTLTDIPTYDDTSAAEAAGYRSIGDSVTGDEHYVNWSYVNDGNILDAKKPESLVYEWRNGKQSVVAAMYMLPFGSHFTDIPPDVNGPLTQWHVHKDLCLTNDPVQKLVSSLTTVDGTCPPGTEKAGNTPMLHVWVVPNACGPFAALEGIGAGQVPAGETRLCDTKHGS